MSTPRASPTPSSDPKAFGWVVPQAPEFHWRKLVAGKEAEISRLSGIYETNLRKAGVEVFEERAEILGPHEVRLMRSGRVIRARHILVATGGAPVMHPAIPGLEHAITSNEIFDLPQFPRRLVVVGGGYIAVEFACIFARLGAKVTQLFRADNILRGFDETLREGLRDAMIHDGIALRPGAAADGDRKNCRRIAGRAVQRRDNRGRPGSRRHGPRAAYARARA